MDMSPTLLRFSPLPPDPPYIVRRLDYLQRNRATCSAYMLYRLNKSLCPQNFVKQVLACTFDDGHRSLVCYPLRISNVDVGAVETMKVVAALHNLASRDDWGDIAMISSVLEVDGTLTVDVGFTNIEDALMMWTKDGQRIKGRYWNIQPISAVLGLCHVFQHPPPLYPVRARLLRLSACEVLENALTPSYQPNARLSQLRDILARLAVANGEYPTSAAHLPANEPLEDTIARYGLEGHDWAAPIRHNLSKSARKTLCPNIVSKPEHWTYNSDHDLIHGNFARRGYYFSRPKLRTSQKCSKSRDGQDWQLTNRPPHDLPGPVTSRAMTRSERLFAQKLTRWQANVKLKAWTSVRLKLPPVPEAASGLELVDDLMSIWNWYEKCLRTVQTDGAAVGVQLVPDAALHPGTRVVAESFCAAEISFGPDLRLIGVFGPDYVEFMKRVAEQRASSH
jgi:hypothetical protein